ncbi:MAG: class D sortase [Candidatus Dojkabacteria bacterium]
MKNLKTQSDLQKTFGSDNFDVVSVDSKDTKLTVNKNFNGKSNKELLIDGNDVKVGEKKVVSLIVKFRPNRNKGPFQNKTVIQGDIDTPITINNNSTTTGSNNNGSGEDSNLPPKTPVTTPTPAPTPDTITTPTPVPPASPSDETNADTTTVVDVTPTKDETSTNTTSTVVGETSTVVAASEISFTLPDDLPTVDATQITDVNAPEKDLTASAGISLNATSVSVSGLPNTSGVSFHTGMIVKAEEWIKDNILMLNRNKIIIDKIGVNGPIDEGTTEATLSEGFWRMPQSSNPEEGGNTVIAGHRFTYNYGPLTFYNLNQLSAGDEIRTIWNGKVYNYKVTSLKIVDVEDLGPLEPTDKSTLTLITCTSLTDSSERLVVRATLE